MEESNPSGQDYSNRKTQRINGHILDGHDNIKHIIYTNGLNIFRSQELLPVSLDTRVQSGTRRLDSALTKAVPDISRP